jgi:hypothetical protein
MVRCVRTSRDSAAPRHPSARADKKDEEEGAAGGGGGGGGGGQGDVEVEVDKVEEMVMRQDKDKKGTNHDCPMRSPS